ncbi:MAG: PEP-utilizing enzyme [Candidatus Krumholzibacteria bacterium]|nr:PEP-utilizing enzyme [Candidatus Krumholzibacteria bacterium]
MAGCGEVTRFGLLDDAYLRDRYMNGLTLKNRDTRKEHPTRSSKGGAQGVEGLGAFLQGGWVIANHILVSFHVAFISSVLALPAASILKADILRFIFLSPETLVSALFMYISFHTGIALHEIGHFLTAARLTALNDNAQREADRFLRASFFRRAAHLMGLFVRTPYGTASGIKRQGLNYYPDAPYNLAVAAAGPRASRNVAVTTLPPAALLLTVGLLFDVTVAIYAGRLLLGIGLVTLLDFRLADPGKYVEFRERERKARAKAATVTQRAEWWDSAPVARRKMLDGRIQKITHPRLGAVTAPWQFRNCGMGGRHTEKEYPESNISMQEAMFMILGARDYQEAQEMTVRLQNRLKEIIEKEEGCRVMGIGLEGGLAPYIERGPYPLPEVRLWMMMKQTIAECGYTPGVDVAIALDPAMSELEIAYREEFQMSDAVGMYLFWRDKTLTVMDRDGVMDLYVKAIQEYDIPILSIEDGFSENDYEGWKKLLETLGDRVFVIGDDLVTTNDSTIELASAKGLINTALIKANQIGSLYETLIAMLVALGKGMELVVSHRSKSPNDDMEAQIALATNSLGLKAGGGANTERLVKYNAVTELMQKGIDRDTPFALQAGQDALVRRVYAYEEPTNAGVPTVGATVELYLPQAGVLLKFRGSTPLGTSAGSGEAIHLIDSTIESAEHRELINRYAGFFRELEPGVYAFKNDVEEAKVKDEGDDPLKSLFARTQRYEGKGCLNAVDNVVKVIGPAFVQKPVSAMTLRDIDRLLLSLELRIAQRRHKLDKKVSTEDRVRVMQRKQNLGMNAILSVSLALARGLAHLQGKDLFELLREEMLSIIAKLAALHHVEIKGSQFTDYVTALRQVNETLAAEGKHLYQVLRELTSIYEEIDTDVFAGGPAASAGASGGVPEAALNTVNAIAPKLGPTYAKNPHHGLCHTKGILRWASDLADKLGVHDEVDWPVLAAAACLHDVTSQSEKHAAEAAARARITLMEDDILAPQEIDRVEKAIRLHEERSKTGADGRRAAGLEAQILYDADQLEAFGVKGIYRYVAIYTERNTPLERIREDANTRYQTLTFDEARTLASSDFAYTQSFLQKHAQEVAHDLDLLGACGVVEWIRTHSGMTPVALADEALATLKSSKDSADLRFATDFFEVLRSVYVEEDGDRMDAAVSQPVVDETLTLTPDEERELAAVNASIYGAYSHEADSVKRDEALSSYVTCKRRIARRTGRFGIANNRMFRHQGEFIVPYVVADRLVVKRVDETGTATIAERSLPTGTIITDGLIKRMADFDGDAVDLEDELFHFGDDRAVPVRVSRIQDMAERLGEITQGANRNEAVYVLRILVARLSVFSFRKYLNAKNLQSEVQHLLKALMGFLNTPRSNRFPFLVRILVRNIAGVVTKPKVIDRLWNDTIDLAEIHVRGSAIVNELRRSTHHAVGRRTLLLANSYVDYLNSGDMEGLSKLGYDAPSPADEKARHEELPKRIVAQIVTDLEYLLGNTEIIARVSDWQKEYADTLIRCGFGRSLLEEVEEAAGRGVHERNRWVYYHHLRVIRSRVRDFPALAGDGGDTDRRLAALLELKPDESGFDIETAENDLRRCVDDFIKRARAAYQTELFKELETFLAAYSRNAFIETFAGISDLRKTVRNTLMERAFPEQRLLLYQLDCLLEEMGYLALRHIASEYEESGVDIRQCLGLIRACILNLTHDGLHSRQLLDLAGMLIDGMKTYAEVTNVLEQVQRNYHHMLQRLIVPLERMQEKLQLNKEELQVSLANMQRYLHDLNSMAYFCDTALTHIKDHVVDRSNPVDGEAPTVDRDAHDIIHLSSRDHITKRVESDLDRENLRELFGGKGSGLIYISYLNVPTRDGFIIPTTLPRRRLHETDWPGQESEIMKHLRVLETDVARRDGAARKFGDAGRPLLLAIRGGSVFSMPGMLSTVLFLGMNDEIAEGLAKADPWHAHDSYRRFLASYGQAVWGVDIENYNLVDETKSRYGVQYKDDLPWEGMKEVTQKTKEVLRKEGYGEALDELLADPIKQLTTAVRAVFDSWNNNTARQYREIKGICDSWQTAVIVQEMAFGNRKNEQVGAGMDETGASLTGVISRTRVTDLGVRIAIGDFKFSAAGDDLVAGLTTSTSFQPLEELAASMPSLARRIRHTVAKLRRFMGTDQEIEFTVDRGVLSVLQSRAAEIGRNRTEATFENAGEEDTRGIGIRGSAFRGLVAFDEEDFKELSAVDISQRDDVDGVIVLVENPAPEDIPLILSAGALLATKGGSTSHAAVAINGIEDKDYSAVMSAGDLQVRSQQHEASILGKTGTARQRIGKGDIVSIHGGSGAVYVGSRHLKRA